MLKTISLALAATAALGALAVAARHQPDVTATFRQDAPPVPLGKMAPDFSVKTLDGKTVKLSSMRGKPVFLDFWATWCGPCRMALPHTQELAVKNKSKISVLAISDEDVPTIKGFMKENKYSFPSYRDADHSAATKYKVAGIPCSVVIDKNGKLVSYIVGYDPDGVKAALAKVGIN